MAGCAAMVIQIAASGGLGGIGAPAKTVEVDALEPAMRDRVCEAFTPDNLRRLGDAPPGLGADRLTYQITVDGEPFTVPEAALPPEMLDMIDDL